jgi:hypothetical protein
MWSERGLGSGCTDGSPQQRSTAATLCDPFTVQLTKVDDPAEATYWCATVVTAMVRVAVTALRVARAVVIYRRGAVTMYFVDATSLPTAIER